MFANQRLKHITIACGLAMGTSGAWAQASSMSTGCADAQLTPSAINQLVPLMGTGRLGNVQGILGCTGTKTASSTDALNVPLETWQFSNSLRVLTIQFRNGLMVDFRTVSLEAAQGLVTFDPTTSVLTIPALTILAGSGSTSNTQVTKVKLSLPANDLWRLVSVANAQGVDLPVAEPTAPVQEGAVTVTRSTLKSFFGIAAGSYLQLADSTTWIAGSDCAFAKPTGSKITTTTAASGSGLTAVPASTTVTEIPAVPYDTSAVIYRQSGKYWITLPQVQPGACTVDKVFG